MQDSIRKHILSEYAISVIPYNGYTPKDSYQNQSILNVSDPTVLTENIENSDPDEFRLTGPSYLTHAVEESDPDEFVANAASIETRHVEISDPDEMRMGPTSTTFTVETTDDDEFLLM